MSRSASRTSGFFALVLAVACGEAAADAPASSVGDSVPGVEAVGEDPVRAREGGVAFPDALGARFDTTQKYLRVRVYSGRATRIDVVFFASATGESERLTITLTPEATSGVRSAVVPVSAIRAAGIAGPVLYGFRAWGPNWSEDAAWAPGSSAGFHADVDSQGNRFNPNKVLFDPYARELTHDPESPAVKDWAAYDTGAERRAIDSAPFVPKALALAEIGSTSAKPTRPLTDDVVYEVHVRGFTKSDASVAPDARGTYAGVAQKAAYLRDLGVTAIELLPVHETSNEANDAATARRTTNGMNYWGYSSLSYFAPDRRYASDQSPGGPTREFAAMVDVLHAEGIKVILDVVYNHTGEGGVGRDASVARLLSLRGLDNPAYYELTADRTRTVDNTGTTGNVNVASAPARRLILDSLGYWKDALGVDGFRFDLASVLGNSCETECFRYDAADQTNVLNRAVRELGARPPTGGAGVDLVAEPWAIGAGTYQLGKFPLGWAEWNDSFRDMIRSAQNEHGGVAIPPAALIAKLSGSPDVFAAGDRGPSASVNYVASHDGFTLRDLYSYDVKRNDQQWPFGPSDGGDNANRSSSQRGDVLAQRQATRTALALVLTAAGVPMITGGDELYRTQYGNNNAYNLDTEKNWIDWASRGREAEFFAFARGAMRFRNAHRALRPAVFRTGRDGDGNGLKDIAWLTDRGEEMSATYAADAAQHFVAFRVDGAEAGDEAPSLYVAYNAWTAAITATLPQARGTWFVAGDSAAGVFAAPGAEVRAGSTVTVAPRSLVVLIEH